MPDIRIIETSDGSQSLYRKDLNETYHSTHGAITESQYVFIQHGLDFLSEQGRESVSILEVGFGTGLNALLTLDWAKSHEQKITYSTLEPIPLTADIYTQLNYHELINGSVNQADLKHLHEAEWEQEHQLTDNFTFFKTQSKLQDFQSEKDFDLVYYDAFAPSKQAEMWDYDVLEKTADLMAEGAVLVTYCARGQFKRDLAALGLSVETLKGPPGKKEMVRGIKH
ncbi:tRNA (5-methylaminomethyl-2-thiouridine)(34)-methyltransferase MnmD [Roseivirga pacifica]|uniref:tRNA (5-methylaminomethyl-2-thiouridine)(34)-methyltransferase MnmD n=1 Tax=Roseivirga pacifica TaxID=1267423 RepID=UPI00227C3E0B|nr:tRNA (5-methylaminomethyl-2-thiouridine)(34)-methyltransferase MnmD [Roseivirga pacifica]